MDHTAITRRRIAVLTELLGHRPYERSGRAERRLIALGKRAVDQLMQSADSGDAGTRAGVAWTLGQIGDHRAFEVLLRLAQDHDDFTRYEAAWALGHLGDERAVEPMIRMMLGEDQRAAYGAEQGLHLLGSAVVKPLRGLLRSPVSRVRVLAIYQLLWACPEQTIEDVASLLNDADEEVRQSARDAIAYIQDETEHPAVEQPMRWKTRLIRSEAREEKRSKREDARESYWNLRHKALGIDRRHVPVRSSYSGIRHTKLLSGF